MSKKKLNHYNSPMSRATQMDIWHREIRESMTDEQYYDLQIEIYKKYLRTWDESLDYSVDKYTSSSK